MLENYTNDVIAKFEERGNKPLIDFCKQTGDEIGLTANAVRIILLRAGALDTSLALPEKTEKVARTSKAGAQASLIEALKSWEAEPDMEIITRMTGKACAYFAKVLNGQTEA